MTSLDFVLTDRRRLLKTLLIGGPILAVYATALQRAPGQPGRDDVWWSALVGLIDVVLMYVVAKRIFRREFLALVAAGVLALTPAHFIHSRVAVHHLYPLPVVMAWLLCVLSFVERKRLAALCAGTCVLALGLYVHPASVVMMPVYFLLTWMAIARGDTTSLRPYAAALAGFTVPLVPFLTWHFLHPAQQMQLVRTYSLYDSGLDPLQGLRELLNYASLTERSGVYWSYFNPSFLFLSSRTSFIGSTEHAGVFLYPIAVLLPVGFYETMKCRTELDFLTLTGFLSAPLAATLVAERDATHLALVMLPFAALMATRGVDRLLSARLRPWRLAGLLLLAAVPIQFGVFYADYRADSLPRASARTWLRN